MKNDFLLFIKGLRSNSLREVLTFIYLIAVLIFVFLLAATCKFA